MTGDHDSGELIARALATTPLPADDLGLEAARRAYRRSRTARRARRRWARTVTLTLGATVAMSGGVAAAYAASLPAPVQRAAHHIFSALGVPAPHHELRHEADASEHVVTEPRRRQETARPAAAPPLLLRADQATAIVGETVTLTTTSPDRRAGRPIVLVRRVGAAWQDYARAATNADGTALFRLRISADGVFAAETAGAPADRSLPVTLVARPLLRVVTDKTAAGWRVEVHGEGAAPGDRVLLVVDSPAGVRRVVASGRFGLHHWARLDLARPSAHAHYLVEVPATARHGQAQAPVTAPVTTPVTAPARRR